MTATATKSARKSNFLEGWKHELDRQPTMERKCGWVAATLKRGLGTLSVDIIKLAAEQLSELAPQCSGAYDRKHFAWIAAMYTVPGTNAEQRAFQTWSAGIDSLPENWDKANQAETVFSDIKDGDQLCFANGVLLGHEYSSKKIRLLEKAANKWWEIVGQIADPAQRQAKIDQTLKYNGAAVFCSCPIRAALAQLAQRQNGGR